MPLFSLILQSAIGALLLLAGPASTPAPNLKGTWVPDLAHSTQSKTLTETAGSGAAPAPPAAPQATQDQLPAMRLTHGEGRLVIELLEADGSVISTTTLTTDGSENVNRRAGGALIHRSTSEWNGAVLRTRWAIEREGQVVISGTEERELLSPTTLRMVTKTQDSKSRSESVVLYRRKPSA
jgi:hypothetical protein